MADLENACTYIGDLLIKTNLSWMDHLERLEEVFIRLKDAGLKVNAKKSFFGRHELEYLGYWITRSGIQPLPKKIQAILNIATPKTTRDVRKFVGMINYYRDMWIRRSELLAPLTKLCSKKAKFEWTEAQQTAFEKVKQLLSREVLLNYPDFSKQFDIYTDASDYQLGAVITQNEKPIAFYSRKLTAVQQRYTTTERELLAIVETLKEVRNILLGQTIKVFTDHQNLTYKTFNTNRVMRWRLLLEEYGPELIHLPGKTNIVADALSRLDLKPLTPQPDTFVGLLTNNAELFAQTNRDLPAEYFPLTFKNICKHQQNDTKLLADAKTNSTSDYTMKTFHEKIEQLYVLMIK